MVQSDADQTKLLLHSATLSSVSGAPALAPKPPTSKGSLYQIRADTYTSFRGILFLQKTILPAGLLRVVLKLLPFVLPKMHPPTPFCQNSSLQGKGWNSGSKFSPKQCPCIRIVLWGKTSSLPLHSPCSRVLPSTLSRQTMTALGFLYCVSQYWITGVIFFGNFEFWEQDQKSRWKQTSVPVCCKQVCGKIPNMVLMLPVSCRKVCLLLVVCRAPRGSQGKLCSPLQSWI